MHTLAQLRAGQLAGLRRLDLAEGLREFPPEIFQLADTLEVLNLSGNQLSHLPDTLPQLHKLRILFLSDNQFEQLPAVLGRCPNLTMLGLKANRIHHIAPGALTPSLRWLILTDNRLAALPAEIGQCRELQKLMLAGNALRSLPAELAQCQRLELLRIAANQFSALPDWLFTLPQLRWLAIAGNPCCPDLPSSQPSVPWAALQLHEQLGEGASGQIFRADWRQPDGTNRTVALKLFRGALTSDGLPQSELAACLQAGRQANLPEVLGELHGHPDGRHGLLMALIPSDFRNLAGPPSLASCSRDCYPAELSLSAAQLRRIAQGVAAAMQQLHARGLSHGDLYAHNLLWRGDGEVLLSDFGAASPLAALPPEQALAMQRLEASAFGCLLAELLAHCHEADELIALDALAGACQQPEPQLRPSFAAITAALAQPVTR